MYWIVCFFYLVFALVYRTNNLINEFHLFFLFHKNYICFIIIQWIFCLKAHEMLFMIMLLLIPTWEINASSFISASLELS